MLDERLGTALSLYERCDLAADIGTDHARLPAALLTQGICRRMILTDLSEKALANARREITRRGLENRAELRLGDGLEPLCEECGMISILGMGGRTIAEILTQGQNRLRGASLLLSAHTDLDQVRAAITAVGYHLDSETPCLDEGRYYLIMVARPGEEKLTELQLRLGVRLRESGSPRLLPYLRHRQEVLLSRLEGLTRAQQRDVESIRRAEAEIRELESWIR